MAGKIPVEERMLEGGDLSPLIAELRQWHVFRAAATYGVVSWIVVQVVATVGPAFDVPAWVLRVVVLTAIVGFLATMGLLVFRSREAAGGRSRIYLSPKARAIAAAGVLVIAAAAAALSIRSLTAPDKVSVAVLPFEDLSPAHDKGYFAQGVAEEIQSSLAKQRGIKVLGRTSASKIERDADPRAVRTSLGVTHLLEGTTRADGNHLRVNVRLVETAGGSEVWEEEYSGELTDIFSVQDHIAQAVTQRLRGTFFGEAVQVAEPTSIDAYEAYLAARALIRQTTRQSITRAWHMARQIVNAHPDYAPGQALFAEATSLLADTGDTYGDIPPDKARQIASAHALKAIQLTPDRAEGYAALGLALPSEQAIAPYQKALALDPSRVDVRGRLGIALNDLKRNDEAFQQYSIAADMDPLSQAMLNRYIQALAASGMADQAMLATEQFVRRSGMVAQGWRFRGNTYRYLGEESQHIAARRRALQLDPTLPYQHEWLARSLYLLRFNDLAAQQRPELSPYYQLFIADDRGALKQRVAADGARAWLTNGVESAVFSLARARDWPALVSFYDVRPPDFQDVCVTAPRFAPFLIMALEQSRRTSEAQRLIRCMQRDITSELQQKHRSPDDMPGEVELVQSSLLALANNHSALDWLAKAVDRGWFGQYYSANLTDWPQFDRFVSDPQFIAIQKGLDAKVAMERMKVLASR
jgi:TolB-like protein/tetratricopeptide (TPR) repeat protein